ncbi:hypothetical protein N9W21_05350 [Shewanella sp.]|nr:hypothetical protein [Shewanella sp.]
MIRNEIVLFDNRVLKPEYRNLIGQRIGELSQHGKTKRGVYTVVSGQGLGVAAVGAIGAYEAFKNERKNDRARRRRQNSLFSRYD